MDLPDYDDLPPAPQGGRSAWGIFGQGDQLGLLNLQTPERVKEAARLVRKGAVFPLDAPVDAFDPPLASGRGVPRHGILHGPGTIGFDDVLDNFFPQASSQWDSLAHVGYAPDQFYNGATEADILARRRNGIDTWAARGIAGRAVLLDMPAVREYDPGGSVAFGVEDLEAAREHAGIEWRPGDVLLLHTGFAAWYRQLDATRRHRLPRELKAPGIDHDEPVARYLWNAHVSAVCTDTFAVEVWPPDFRSIPFGFIHRVLIGQFGMALGELWWLADLAADCRADGVYEAFLASTPLNLPGGIGSPANALAVK